MIDLKSAMASIGLTDAVDSVQRKLLKSKYEAFLWACVFAPDMKSPASEDQKRQFEGIVRSVDWLSHWSVSQVLMDFEQVNDQYRAGDLGSRRLKALDVIQKVAGCDQVLMLYGAAVSMAAAVWSSDTNTSARCEEIRLSLQIANSDAHRIKQTFGFCPAEKQAPSVKKRPPTTARSAEKKPSTSKPTEAGSEHVPSYKRRG
ncbi:hypothetical protein [Roseibium sp. Sym1]|uniref:hypothetical protein n=1 Tax=Roseibium sp. Sym1 TaxID=3016006 RepID=UPI0022B5B5F6|nr:hypothetical protein [Roseibium sp. Sym1]